MDKESGRARVVLYTRSGCHLCDEAKAEILAAGCSDEYLLEEIDIATDAALVARFGTDIPVIFINEIKAFKHRLTAAEFRRKLRRLSRA